MDYRQEMQKLSNIVNKHITPFTKKQTNELDFFKTGQLFSPRGNNVTDIFFEIFNTKASIQKCVPQSLFHYKKYDFAYQFVEGDYVTASALSNFTDETKKEDVKEYEHFFEVANIGTDKSYIDNQKDNYYIFCLTNDNCTERFWKEYADDSKGLCLELEIIYKKSNFLYDLNRICYDNGIEFQFFADMQNEIHTTLGKYLLVNGLAKFGALYKRTKFDWERETRLLLHENNVNNMFEVSENNNKKYMTIPFENQLFSVNLKSVTLGKNLTNYQRIEIEDLLKKKNIKLR